MAHSLALLQGIQYLSKGQHSEARLALAAIRASRGVEAPIAARFLAFIDKAERKYAQALATLEQANIEFSQDPKILNQLAEYSMDLGDYDQAIDYAEQSLGIEPNNATLRLNVASWQSSRSANPAQIRLTYESWCKDYLDTLSATQAKTPLRIRDPRSERKLRIGYVSGDLKNHAVRYFIEPYLRMHDRRQFEIHTFMTQAPDAITDILKASVEHWHDVQKMSHPELLALIQQLEIDILVDLSGHTEGARLEVFALRAAPVQVTWWGFVQTLGMREMDYRLTDAVTCPPQTDQFYTEALCRMKCLTAYTPPLNSDAFYPTPYLHNGYVTMVSINHSRKVSNQALALWRKVLIANPTARLIIVTMESTQDGADALFKPRLIKLDLPLDRVQLIPRLTMHEFMRISAIADFSLDSLPISGGVTTFHALWMGLPILTIRPSQPIALQSYTANILELIQLSECIAQSPEDFLAKAQQWIKSPATIDRIRNQCRPRLQNSLFMDHPSRVTELESCYRQMWVDHLNTL